MEIALVIIIGTIGIVVISFFIILFVLTHQKKVLEQKNIINANEASYQKNLLNASLEIAEQERQKVAANIHDDVGIILTVLKQKINRAAKQPEIELTRNLLTESTKMVDETIQIIRNISNDLMPPTLSNFGITSAFTDMCSRLDGQGIVNVKYQYDSEPESGDKKKMVQLYRLVKEILNNVLKHGGASEIAVSSLVNKNTFTILIEHNGQGITNEEIKQFTNVSAGLGLKSIVARGQLLGADINYQIPESKTPRILIETPLAAITTDNINL